MGVWTVKGKIIQIIYLSVSLFTKWRDKHYDNLEIELILGGSFLK